MLFYEVYSTKRKLLSIGFYIIFSLRPAGWWHAIFSNVPKGLCEQIKRIKNTFKFLKIDTVCMLLMEMEKYRQYPVNSLLQEQVDSSNQEDKVDKIASPLIGSKNKT